MAAKKPAVAKSPKSAVRSSSPRERRPAGAKSVGAEATVTIDRRRNARRNSEAAQVSDEPVVDAQPAATPALERRKKVARRRQIDPTTCERDYSIEEVEFMNAMDEYKRKNGRMFPTCSEVLEVIRGLGYTKLSSNERAMLAAEATVAERLDAVTETLDALVEETL